MAPADTMYYWGHSYLAIFYMVSLLNILLNQGSPNLAFLRSKVLQFYGKISYSTYLFHPTIIGLFFLSKGRTESLSTIGDTTLLAGAFAVTTAFCWSSYLLLEEPLFLTLTLSIDNTIIPTVQRLKILGLTFDPKLNFGEHITQTKERQVRQ